MFENQKFVRLFPFRWEERPALYSLQRKQFSVRLCFFPPVFFFSFRENRRRGKTNVVHSPPPPPFSHLPSSSSCDGPLDPLPPEMKVLQGKIIYYVAFLLLPPFLLFLLFCWLGIEDAVAWVRQVRDSTNLLGFIPKRKT